MKVEEKLCDWKTVLIECMNMIKVNPTITIFPELAPIDSLHGELT